MTGRNVRPDAPTQVAYPWRAVVRTGFQLVVGIAAAMPLIVASSGLPQTAAGVGLALGISAAITRVMAIPAVDAAIGRWLPWLAASGTSEG
ncbi:hypothetical protein ACQPW1_39650 [Nocardia sp. CA-128927]|uniref:hypothetical protein n=1 Tax=Nocardia sp. CA-128927 TaxID=3239975 RepID=UPI003D95791F